MKEEQYILNKVGRENPFRVPEGYFDTLTDEVMARIDAEPAAVVRLRPLRNAVAASVCALLVGGATFLLRPSQTTTDTVVTAATSLYESDDFDEAADYVMVDNQDIYACLSADY